MRVLFADFFGTLGLVFAGTGAIVINNDSGGMVSHVGIALTFGLVVLAMIYAIGDVSGAHINPAVTIGFWIAGRFPLAKVPPYILVQCSAALCASLLLKFLYPADPHLGATLPAGSSSQSFIIEVFLTLMLMVVVLCVSTGASMNPARSLGPALASGHLEHLWLYLAAPTLGAILAFPVCRIMRGKNCCQGCCCPPSNATPEN
jgi:aquaporin NIP